MSPNRRIFLNIVATYRRSLYALVIGLFCGRRTLMVLDEVDYGLMKVESLDYEAFTAGRKWYNIQPKHERRNAHAKTRWGIRLHTRCVRSGAVCIQMARHILQYVSCRAYEMMVRDGWNWKIRWRVEGGGKKVFSPRWLNVLRWFLLCDPIVSHEHWHTNEHNIELWLLML